jgi:hypothetical protein
MSTFNKYLTSISTTIGLLSIANLGSIDTAQAFSANLTNGGFESSFSDGWTTTGDSSRQATFQSISPSSGSNQALITNTYETRNDDSPASTGIFNPSGTNPISASIEQSGNLQNFLGLSANSLSIPRENSLISGLRTPKEGSGFKQTFTVTEGGDAIVDFNWNFLTNDGSSSLLGDSDFAFTTLYKEGSDLSTRTIDRLSDSTGTVPTMSSGSTNFSTTSGNTHQTYSKTFTNLTPGTYTLGFGVVDADGSDRSSGLLVDNVNVRAVPFEFSPSLGLGVVAVIFGCDRLRRQIKVKSDIKF